MLGLIAGISLAQQLKTFKVCAGIWLPSSIHIFGKGLNVYNKGIKL